MIPGLSGTLLSEDALLHSVPDSLRGLLGETDRSAAYRSLRAWHSPLRRQLGPAAGARTVFDRLAVPLLSQMGYRVSMSDEQPAKLMTTPIILATLRRSDRALAALVVTGWGQDPATVWRRSVREAIVRNLRWCFCLTGNALRVVDGARTYSRRYVELDLEAALDHERTFAVLWGLLSARAMAGTPRDARPLLERAIEISERHRAAVRSSLQNGVHEALTELNRAFTQAMRRQRRRATGSSAAPNIFSESLIVIYRLLFLLFAEARGLVPGWHPIYRDGYTIEALRQPVELLPRPRGLWEAIQSIARLAHRGCRIGQLRVTPFNGRLFSPVESPLADSVSLDDGPVRQALLALTTRKTSAGRQRIAYADLGVEQLGGVYEGVLDLDTAASRAGHANRRKTTGTFYTPRALTECLVRRTLAPLVAGRSSEEILELKILDPAMGSGAFLVAACRHLATAYESALINEGVVNRDELREEDRADFRRAIAQRCLYGVDINPMAVQLGRLSLWLATLAADRPLTFLDHRLRIGNSLVGAFASDLATPPRSHRPRSVAPLPLFDDPEIDRQLQDVVAVRTAIGAEPGRTLAQVRAKEQALAGIAANVSVVRWKEACDVWCSSWFDRDRRTRPAEAATAYRAVIDSIFNRPTLPARVTDPMRLKSQAVAARERFFHWGFEFPEVFIAAGLGGRRSGFDAVVGNPPWEMLRADDPAGGPGRRAARDAIASLMVFAHHSGAYSLQGAGHANLYHLFLERMLRVLRPGGRLGAVLPSGVATDRGAATLRRLLLHSTSVDTFVSIENRSGIFPIHRGLRFLLLTTTNDGHTITLPCRSGITTVDSLDQLPDAGRPPGCVLLPRALVEKLTGEDLSVPEIRSQQDVEILGQIGFQVPALASHDGWSVSFGRELNASDDKAHFVPASGTVSGLPVLEGKMITPFKAWPDRVVFRIPERAAARLVEPNRTFRRTRLAYRDVSSPTNRVTLIAALVPAGVITTHTLFCLREDLPEQVQRFLCGMFNSYVANYLVRMHLSTHVTAALIARLRVPRPSRSSPEFRQIVELSHRLERSDATADDHARLQALAASLYALRESQFDHVLSTFPLIPIADRDRALRAFCDIVG